VGSRDDCPISLSRNGIPFLLPIGSRGKREKREEKGKETGEKGKVSLYLPKEKQERERSEAAKVLA